MDSSACDDDAVYTTIKLLNSLTRDLDRMLANRDKSGSLSHQLIPSTDSKSSSNNNNNNSHQRLVSADMSGLVLSEDLSAQKRPVIFNSSTLVTLPEDESEDDGDSSFSGTDSPPCQMSIGERLLRCHPVWFLPSVRRSGAEHLLQGKPAGSFIVRQSSKRAPLALSVRLPVTCGPHVQHYLVMERGQQLALETLDRCFDNISSLVAYYCQHSGELPTLLKLPDALLRAESRQQLSSLALLGQEFWLSRLASPGLHGSPAALPSDGGSVDTSPESSLGKCTVVATGVTTSSDTGSSGGVSPTDDSLHPGPTLLRPINEDSTGVARPTPPSSLQLRSPALVGGMVVRGGPQVPPKPPPRWFLPDSGGGSPLPPPPHVAHSVLTTATFNISPPCAQQRSELNVLVGGGAGGGLRKARSAASTPLTAVPGWPLPAPSPATTPASCDDDLILWPGGSSRPRAVAFERRRSRAGRRKHSTDSSRSSHYREADVVADTYCRSSLADKMSDYEDIWIPSPLQDRQQQKEHHHQKPVLSSSFKPRAAAVSLNDLTSTQRPRQLTTAAVIPSAVAVRGQSPLYAVPADAVLRQRRRQRPFERRSTHRHSEPNIRWEPPHVPAPILPTIEDTAGECVNRESAVVALRSQRAPSEYEADTEEGADDCDVVCRSHQPVPSTPARRPDVPWSSAEPDFSAHSLTKEEQSRIVHELVRRSMLCQQQQQDAQSEYDNVSRRHEEEGPDGAAGSRPVDKWRSIVRLMTDQMKLRSGQFDEESTTGGNVAVGGGGDSVVGAGGFTDTDSFVNLASAERFTDGEETDDTEVGAHDSTRNADEPLYSAPHLNSVVLHRRSRQTGANIRDYVLKLASDDSNTFALSIHNFIQCTREGSITEPTIVMRNVRQFINGMKNYLVKHGEGNFNQIVLHERNKLSSNEFLNLDAILEGVLEELLVLPLHEHLRHLYDRREVLCDVTRLSINWLANSDQFDSREDQLTRAKTQLAHLHKCVSPLDKLEHYLMAVSCLFRQTANGSQHRPPLKHSTMSADDLLPLLVHALIQCNLSSVEFECDYMLMLLHPLLLDGEAGYYLALLSSAVHVLKLLQQQSARRPDTATIQPQHTETSLSPDSTRESNNTDGVRCGTLESVLRILVPDEGRGTILTRSVPARPGVTARHVCHLLAHKLHITTPQDYGLFQLLEGTETLLADSDLPQKIKLDLSQRNVQCILAYKRLDAKIAWPTTPM